MAGSLGSMFVSFGADTKGFDAGVDGATGRLSRFGTQARKGINVAAKYGAAMAAAGAAIVTKFVKDQFTAIDAASKLSRQLNTTTASIATMNRAGQLAGIQDMTGNMDQLNRRLSEAIGGTGRAADAMDKLGLSARELQNLPIDERMRRISRAMQDNVDVTEQAALANDLFGRSGGQMLEVLRDADGLLDKASAQAEAFGLAVSDVDAQAIERANDAMSSIRAVLDGIFTRIAVKVAPIVEHLAKKFEEAAMDVNGFEAQVNSSMANAQKAVGWVADAVRGLEVGFAIVEAAGWGLSAAMVNIAAITAKAFTLTLKGISDGVLATIEAMNRIKGVNISTDGLESFSNGVAATQEVMDGFAKSATESFRAALRDADALSKKEMPSEGFRRFFEEIDEASRKAAESFNRTRSEFAEGVINDETAEAELAALREHAEKKLEQLRESLLTEREAEQEHHDARMDMLKEAQDQELLSQEEIDELKERELERHWQTMHDITQRGAKEAADAALRESRRQAMEYQRNMNAMHQGANQVLSAMAQDNKAFGIAQAVLNTWRGVSESLAAYPMPFAAVAAAGHLAAGMAVVRNIKSQSAGGSIPSGGGAMQSEGGRPGGGSGGGRGDRNEPNRTAIINVSGGDFVTRENALNMAREMEDLRRDGFSFAVPAS